MQAIDYFNLALAVANIGAAIWRRNGHSFVGWTCYLICYAKFVC